MIGEKGMLPSATHLIDSDTALYGVIGDPIRHSRSPLMLNRAFQAAGINAVYTAFHVTPDKLKDAIDGVRALGMGGINVTIPHKENVMKLVDELDAGAKEIGAVNTIVNRDGRLIGYNTDGIGYVRSLKEETNVKLEKSRILVLGAGGAARGVVYALTLEKPDRIYIFNRTSERAERLAKDMSRFGDVSGMGNERMGDIMKEADIVINTTSVGMSPHTEQMPLDPDDLREGQLVSDLIYNPLTTRLLQEAEKRGCRIHGGLGMFVYQGAYAFEYWTGKEAPVQIMREVVEASF